LFLAFFRSSFLPVIRAVSSITLYQLAVSLPSAENSALASPPPSAIAWAKHSSDKFNDHYRELSPSLPATASRDLLSSSVRRHRVSGQRARVTD